MLHKKYICKNLVLLLVYRIVSEYAIIQNFVRKHSHNRIINHLISLK